MDKSPGPDGITNELIIKGRHLLTKPLTKLFNLIIQEQHIPEQWKCSEIVLIYKKGDPKLISNYRPISLLPCLYKIFTSTLLRRLTPTIDDNQPVEQAGFRKNYSTCDHIHSLKQIIEKYTEYDRPLYITFIDYTKAFDSITHESIWRALTEQGVNQDYIDIIKTIYRDTTARIRLEEVGPPFPIERGSKQGDPLSPKLFIAVLESIFRQLNWTDMGIKIDGKYLTHLRFADDLVLLSEDPNQLQYMVDSLNFESKAVGLQINEDKTKMMTNKDITPVTLNTKQLEYVEDYIYLGHLISFKFCNEKEIQRRVKQTWNKYWSMKEIFKGALPIKLKTKAMNLCLTPCLTYACQTWTLTKYTRNKIEVCQRGIERSFLNLRLRDRVKNTTIRKRTKAKDVIKTVLKLKWKWAGHLQRMNTDRWAHTLTNWTIRDIKRKRGRPPKRWSDDIVKTAGKLWPRQARERKTWQTLEEAFTA